MSENTRCTLLAGSFVIAAAWMAGLIGYVVGMDAAFATKEKAL